ncbi:hypothetical protein F4806DRAFT_99649 [Annulohypoxylon nitens]|nr:hypothetical protein F4806DRAFT_99649 [Annulohypoxylon nitens]
MDSTKGTNPAPASPTRRRGSGPTFDGLMNAKRGNDSTSMARRASLHDQKPQTGFLGQMWHSFTRGPQSPTK